MSADAMISIRVAV